MDFCSVIIYFLILSSVIHLVSYLIVFVVFSVTQIISNFVLRLVIILCFVGNVRCLIIIKETTRLYICHFLERWFDNFRVKGVICSQACRTH